MRSDRVDYCTTFSTPQGHFPDWIDLAQAGLICPRDRPRASQWPWGSIQGLLLPCVSFAGAHALLRWRSDRTIRFRLCLLRIRKRPTSSPVARQMSSDLERDERLAIKAARSFLSYVDRRAERASLVSGRNRESWWRVTQEQKKKKNKMERERERETTTTILFWMAEGSGTHYTLENKYAESFGWVDSSIVPHCLDEFYNVHLFILISSLSSGFVCCIEPGIYNARIFLVLSVFYHSSFNPSTLV